MRMPSTAVVFLFAICAGLLLAACGGQERIEPAASPTAARAPSATTGKIAYVGIDANIWAINPDGSGKTRLNYANAPPTSGPTWSPDGALLAYVDGLYGNVWIIDVDGGNEIRLTSNGKNSEPQWSADGKRLAYIHASEALHIMGADGAEDTRLPLADSCEALRGTAYMEGAPPHLTNPRWAHDGSGLYYHEYTGGVTFHAICFVPLAPGAPTHFEPFKGAMFDVSPIEDRIASVYGGQATWELTLHDRSGRDEVTLVPAGELHGPWRPLWSPGGTEVAYFAVDTASEGSLRVAKADGSQIKTVATFGSREAWPESIVWAPSSDALAYESAGAIWVIDLAPEASPRRLVDGTSPSWGVQPHTSGRSAGTALLRQAEARARR